MTTLNGAADEPADLHLLPWRQLGVGGAQHALHLLSRDHAPAGSGAERGGGGEPQGRDRQGSEKLGSNVAVVKPDNIADAVAARWLALSPEGKAKT